MIVQQGYLWVQQEVKGVPSSTFAKVYILVVPFCGILSLSQQPETGNLNVNSLIESHKSIGWICGGTILPIHLCEGELFVSEASSSGIFYPLIITVTSDGCISELILYTSDAQSRTLWIESFNQLFSSLLFVQGCADNDHLPTPELFQAVNQLKYTRALSLHQMPVSLKSICMIRHLVKTQLLDCLIKIEFSDVQLTDQHASVISSLIQFSSSHLKHLVLSQNLFTSRGIKGISPSLAKCFSLIALDLSSNLISDSSTASLTDALSHLPNLQIFSIARNRLSNHSTKAFVTRLGNHNSPLQEINFAYNEMGDDLGLMIAFLLRNVPSQLKVVDLSYCGISDISILEIVKQIPHCETLLSLNLQGSSLSADTSRKLIRATSFHHQQYSANPIKLLVRYGGISVNSDGSSFSLSYQSLRSSCLELTDSTNFQHVVLRKFRAFEKSAAFCCFRLESQNWWKGAVDGFCSLLCTGLFDDFEVGLRDGIEVMTESIIFSANHQTIYLFALVANHAIVRKIMNATESSDPLLRRLNVKSIFLQHVTGDGKYQVENRIIKNSGFGGAGLLDHYIPAIAPIDQYDFTLGIDIHEEEAKSYAEFDPLFWTVDTPPLMAEKMEDAVDDTIAFGENDVDLQDEETAGFLQEYQNMLDYENSLREKRLVNERLILAVRRLYQAKEVSSSVAKFWEGMFGNVKYKKYAERELVGAMRHGHEKIYDEGVLQLGLFHLFPAIARREQLYQAMYSRDVEEIHRLQISLQPSIGGYALVYSGRLANEIISLRQQFLNLQLLAKTYAELPLIEEFLMCCGKLSYTGPEMFQAVELRHRLFSNGMSKGGHSFSEMAPIIKARSLIANLLISRDFTALQDKLVEFHNFDVSLLPEISVAENMLQELDQTLMNLRAAVENKDIELMDLALSIAAYWNFFSSEVEICVATLNDVSRNPAVLIRPVVDGLRKGRMSSVDKGFESLLKMGLVHEALDSVVCSKIHAIKSRIIQDDSVKDKLVKVCLALKNGFNVSPGEIMQLYRKANAIKLSQDPSLKAYFKIAQKYSKKYVSLQKQEKVIQELIRANDVYKLSKLLSGRGMGKLIMSFPNSFARDQWYGKFLFVCSGKAIGENLEALESKDFQEEVVFQGVFEKAARNEEGKVRGWRKRFFLLKSVHLFYFTKLHGEKKGSIRVLNGGVRLMDVNEANGKLYCLELEEGRDLTCVSPDLLEEARRHVRFAKIMEIESSLRKGIALKSISLLSKMLKFAAELEVMLDYHLMNEAKHCLRTLQIQQLRKNLYFAAIQIPRSQILQELSNLSNTLMLDPNLQSLKKIRLLLNKSEIEQEIYRCKSSLLHSDHFHFLRSMKILSKIDFTQASIKLKSLYISLLLQFVGICLLDLIHTGVPAHALMKYLKYSLVFCHSYHVELEIMDLIRLVMKLISRYHPDIGSPLTLAIHSSSVIGSNPAPGATTVSMPTDIQTLLEDLFHYPKLQPQFSVSKFPLLRLSSVQSQSNLFFGGFNRRRSSVMDEVMSHSASTIVKSLLKYEVNPLDNHIAVEAFTILQCLMGDLPLSIFKKWKKSKILQSSPTEESMLYDLLHLLLKRYPLLQDEVYFQLAKQLKLNPKPLSRLRGCWLLSIYLHTFIPSTDAFQYIKNHILQLLLDFTHKVSSDLSSGNTSETNHEGPKRPTFSMVEPHLALLPSLSSFLSTELAEGEALFGGNDDDAGNTINHLCRDVCVYCYWLICQAEFFPYSSSPYLTSSSLLLQNSFSMEDLQLIQHVFKIIFKSEKFDFHVVLLTGEIVTLSLHYSQLTYQSLMVRLYEHLIPKSLQKHYVKFKHKIQAAKDLGEEIELFNEYSDHKSSHEKGGIPPDLPIDPFSVTELWKEILSVFDGYGFFRLKEEEINPEDNRIDLMAIPIQPIYQDIVDWNDDLQWIFLEKYTRTRSAKSGEAVTPFHGDNTLILRRLLPKSIELFAESEYEIFGSEILDRDQIQRCKAWKVWLSSLTSRSQHKETLPHDFVRVDLLFSEDTRYVNSRLASLSNESFCYLVALQLSLAWFDSEGERQGHFIHQNSSVASCYKYFPVENVVDDLLKAEGDFSLSEYERRTALESVEVKDIENKSETSSDSDIVAAIDHPVHSALYPHPENDDESSEYVSSIDENTDSEGMAWKPMPVAEGQKMTNEDKNYIILLLAEIGVQYEEGDKENDDSSRLNSGDLENLWQLIAEFHKLPRELGIPITSYKYRYYMKRAYHHYLVAITGLFYEQYLVNGKLVKLELDESVRNEQIEIQEKYIDHFSQIDVLIGLSTQGIYLFAANDWSIVFYSPYWDIHEHDLTTISPAAKSLSSSREEEKEPLKQLLLNINGLKLFLQGRKLNDVLEIMNIYSKEALKMGAFPYGTRKSISELLVFNAYNEEYYPQTKVNSASSFSSSSSMLAQNNNNTLGNQLFQLYLANYSLLPLPPMIDNHAFFRSPVFFVAPPSQREIIANTRYEEEKLEEEIMKLAEQMLLEKNQQQITKGRNEIMHRNLTSEDDEQDDDQFPESVEDANKSKSAGNLNRNVKLKRKNRSVFQGSRLKSNEEIYQTRDRERLDSAVCGVSTKDSIFNQNFRVPVLPFRVKGKVKMPSMDGLQDSFDERRLAATSLHHSRNPVHHLREFQKRPVIESERLLTIGNAEAGKSKTKEFTESVFSLLWSNNEVVNIPVPTKRHNSSNTSTAKLSPPTVAKAELDELWNGAQKDFLRLRSIDGKSSEASILFESKAKSLNYEDSYSVGLNLSLWHRSQVVGSAEEGLLVTNEEEGLELNELETSRVELEL